ncbi:hypothetical protein F2P79_022042 [Pimephales promelas]|nr:hypothetical protein F2P79_022042 [Pimephales promelas]
MTDQSNLNTLDHLTNQSRRNGKIVEELIIHRSAGNARLLWLLCCKYSEEIFPLGP